MVSASHFSLIAPVIKMSEGENLPAWFPVLTVFYLEVFFFWELTE